MKPVVDRLQELFPTVLHVAPPQPTADLVDDDILDSLGLVELLVAIEEEFGIQIPFAEIEIDDIRTLERLAELVTQSSTVEATDAA